MKTRKESYSYLVFQPDRNGVWIRLVSGRAKGCREFLASVKKMFPNAMYRANYDNDFPAPMSIGYADAGTELYKVCNYYAQVTKGDF